MSPTDWLLLGIVAISALLGLMRGFVGVVLSLLGWVAAGWVALRFGGEVAPLLSGGATPGPAHVVAAFALCFVGVGLFVAALGMLVRWAMKSAGLTGVDRTLGLAVGVLRGGFVGCALVLLMGLTTMPREADWQASWVVPMFVPGAELIRGWLPDWAAARVDLGTGGAPPPAAFEDA